LFHPEKVILDTQLLPKLTVRTGGLDVETTGTYRDPTEGKDSSIRAYM
jgi:hypothetical protein